MREPMRLTVLEPKLPRMHCDSGCGRCCGPVTCNDYEFDRVRVFSKANDIKPLRQGITCPFYQGGTCAVYPVRPFVCRMFGHSPRLVCAHGHNVNVPAKREEKLVRDYMAAGTPDLWLHSLAYTEAEMFGIMVGESET